MQSQDTQERTPSPSIFDEFSVPTRLVLKPWGSELIFCETEHYVGKLLNVRANSRLSLQLHEQKHESMYLLSGLADLTIGPDLESLRTIRFTPNTTIVIEPLTIHRLQAIEDSVILEVSTPHLEDIRRFEDDYGRSPGLMPAQHTA